MNEYRQRYNRKPAPRYDAGIPFWRYFMWLTAITILALLAANAAVDIHNRYVSGDISEPVADSANYQDAYAMTYTESGSSIKLYLVTTEDGTRYVVSDRGGICMVVNGVGE